MSKKCLDYNNILQLLEHQAKIFAKYPFIWEKEENNWVATSWSEFVQEARFFAAALLYLGIQDNQAISVLSSNIRQWPIVDFGSIYAGGITSGIYPTSSPEQIAYMVNKSESFALFVDSKAQLEKVNKVRNEFISKVLITKESLASDPKLGFYNYSDFIKLGAREYPNYISKIEEVVQNRRQQDIAIYVFTSGTTGDPKAAMLSHRYYLSSADSIQEIFSFQPGEKILSFLPYCHVGERIFGLAVSVAAGRQIYH